MRDFDLASEDAFLKDWFAVTDDEFVKRALEAPNLGGEMLVEMQVFVAKQLEAKQI